MATYDLAYPGAAIDAILNTAYYLQEAGFIFRGSASDYAGTPSKREWVIAPAGFTGYGISSPVPKGSIGICLYNGTAWVGKIINVVSIDSSVSGSSTNPVSGSAVYEAINQLATGVAEALDNLTFTDTTPTSFLGDYIKMKVSTTDGGVERILTFFTILAATTEKAGLMSAEDKAKVNSFLTGIRSMRFVDATTSAEQSIKLVEQLKWTVGGVQEVIDSITLLAATSSKAGLLSASDKAYIDALPSALTNLSNSISAALALMESLVGYYVCDTAAATAAKTVAATGYSLTNGGCIRIKMTNANTAANVTLNINSTGAKALYYDGAQASSTNTWEAGEVLEVYYDGTQYQCASGGGGKFATGQKVKEVSITDTLNDTTALVESAPVKAAVDNIHANIGYFTCDTAAATAAKVVTAAGYNLTNGGNIRIKMTYANTADNATLNINNTGVKALFYNGAQASSSNSWEAGSVLTVYYDGTCYMATNSLSLDINEVKNSLLYGSPETYSIVGSSWQSVVVPVTIGDLYYYEGTGDNNAELLALYADEACTNRISLILSHSGTTTTPQIAEGKVNANGYLRARNRNYISNFGKLDIYRKQANIITPYIVNNLTDGGTDKALSAEQGKVIGDKLLPMTDVVETINTYVQNNWYRTWCYVKAGMKWHYEGTGDNNVTILSYNTQTPSNTGETVLLKGKGGSTLINEDGVFEYDCYVYVANRNYISTAHTFKLTFTNNEGISKETYDLGTDSGNVWDTFVFKVSKNDIVNAFLYFDTQANYDICALYSDQNCLNLIKDLSGNNINATSGMRRIFYIPANGYLKVYNRSNMGLDVGNLTISHDLITIVNSYESRINELTERVNMATSYDFNVKTYGAMGDGITDDTAAIQSAIDACFAAGGGTVFIPNGVYRLDTIHEYSDGTYTKKGHLFIPVCSDLENRITVKIKGESAVQYTTFYVDARMGRGITGNKGTTLYSTYLPDNPSVALSEPISVITSLGWEGGIPQSTTILKLESFNICVKACSGGYPCVSGVDGSLIAQMDCRDMDIRSDAKIGDLHAAPEGHVCFGIMIGATLCDPHQALHYINISQGFNYGIISGLHLTATCIDIQTCVNALSFCQGGHYSQFSLLTIHHCKNIVDAFSGNFSGVWGGISIFLFDILNYETQNATPTDFTHAYGIVDPTSVLRGRINYHCGYTGPGTTGEFTKNGGSNVTCTQI